MKRSSLMLAAVMATLLAWVPFSAEANRDRERKQAELDAACEKAREKKLAPIREQLIEECVENKVRSNRESCEVFYSDFGAQSGDRAPLFFDLPECVEAFEFQSSQRRR